MLMRPYSSLYTKETVGQKEELLMERARRKMSLLIPEVCYNQSAIWWMDTYSASKPQKSKMWILDRDIISQYKVKCFILHCMVYTANNDFSIQHFYLVFQNILQSREAKWILGILHIKSWFLKTVSKYQNDQIFLQYDNNKLSSKGKQQYFSYPTVLLFLVSLSPQGDTFFQETRFNI